jgi:divalent metal cation (Fe/Co/Zn/Cd) transporter
MPEAVAAAVDSAALAADSAALTADWAEPVADLVAVAAVAAGRRALRPRPRG